MQLFPCPFCGPRAETEFHFAGEHGNLRPDGTDVTAESWSAYLHLRANPKGKVSEIWRHDTCGEIFRMDRDTVTHAVSRSVVMAGEGGE